MERQILTFSAANIITVNLMVFLAGALILFLWARFKRGDANA